ncbi:MAG: hypothetical protein CL448_03010 [Acidimicrobiaceae bacterium]|nr:hypothetical protein [Acidimicrobiaceae bacterium]
MTVDQALQGSMKGRKYNYPWRGNEDLDFHEPRIPVVVMLDSRFIVVENLFGEPSRAHPVLNIANQMNVLIDGYIHRFSSSYNVFLIEFIMFWSLIGDRFWFRHVLHISRNLCIRRRWHYERKFIPIALTRVCAMRASSHNQGRIWLKRDHGVRENIMLDNIT